MLCGCKCNSEYVLIEINEQCLINQVKTKVILIYQDIVGMTKYWVI